jgi:hypothetical protein
MPANSTVRSSSKSSTTVHLEFMVWWIPRSNKRSFKNSTELQLQHTISSKLLPAALWHQKEEASSAAGWISSFSSH